MNLPALPAPNKPIPSFFADAILPVPNEDAGPWVVKNEELLRLPTGIYEVIHCTKIYGARTGWVLKVARGELIIPVHWSSSVSLAAIRSRMYDFILAARKDNLVRYMDKKECVFADRVRTGSHIVAVRELKGTTLQNLLPRIHTRTRTPVL